MFYVIAMWTNQLLPLGSAMSLKSALELVRQYWAKGYGHECVLIQDASTGRFTELCRPQGQEPLRGVFRHANGMTEEFCVTQ